MNTSHELFNSSSVGVKLPYERPSAVFTSPKQESGFVAQGDRGENLDRTCGNFPSSGSPCADC